MNPNTECEKTVVILNHFWNEYNLFLEPSYYIIFLSV